MPEGEVREIRRGGPEVLSLLAKEIALEQLNAYLRTETTLDGVERVGIVGFMRGEAVLAIHQSAEYCEAVEALLEFESDAHSPDSKISLHIMDSLEEVISSYPQALLTGLIRAIPEQSESGEDWWRRQRSGGSSWARQPRLPEQEPVVDAPEYIKRRAKSEMLEASGSIPQLCPSDALLHSSSTSNEVMNTISALAHHGRPYLVISRRPSKQLAVEYGLTSDWLSHKEGGLSPSINSVQERIEEFLNENLRAVVVLDGLEFLAGEHGESRMLDLLRRVVDQVRSENHLLLISCNLNAFLNKDQRLILREVKQIEDEWIEHWNNNVERLIDHPICAEPSEAEREWIAAQIEPIVIPEPEVIEEVVAPVIPEVVPTEPVKLHIEPPVTMPEPEPAAPEPVLVKPKGPRKAQVVKVSRRKISEVKESSIALVEVTLPDMEAPPELLELPAIPMASKVEEFEELTFSRSELSDVIRQPAANVTHELPDIGSGENQIAFHEGMRPSQETRPPKVNVHARESAFANHKPTSVESASKKWHEEIEKLRDETQGGA